MSHCILIETCSINRSLFCFFSLYHKMENNVEAIEKRPKEKDMKWADDIVADLVCKSKSSFDHLVKVSWLGENELVAIGVNPVTLVEQLPSSLKEKRFGVS